MSENIITTLITSISVLLSALIGASATIIAASKKEGEDRNLVTSIGLVLLVASIAGVIGLVVGLVLSNVYVKQIVQVPVIVTSAPAPQIGQQPSTVPQTSGQGNETLSALCEGTEPLIFHNGLPAVDPCNGIVASNIVPYVWVVVEPRTNAGWQKGKCLYSYPNGDRSAIYEGSIWALYSTDSVDGNLPTCPQTAVVK